MAMSDDNILIADAGGTSTTWVLISSGGTETECRRGAAINAAVTNEFDISESLAAISDMMRRASAVYFYGAGCIGGMETESLRLAIMRHTPSGASVEVHSDMTGAARASLGKHPGIACILGTGANTCCYDGAVITDNIRPLGFILGDEGSGAALGKRFMKQLLRGCLPPALTEDFYTVTGLTYQEIIKNIYRESGANKYLASFTRYILRHIGERCVEEIVLAEFEEFFETFIMRYPGCLDAACGFIGSVADCFAPQLRTVARRKGISIKSISASPVQGLIKYHLSSI
ncbi:MAG: ATPase [Muribaculaceae bacterium]|nr:ATPase [Muribaculaceae bacterium]